MSYLVLHHGPLVCAPAVVGVVCDGGGAAKVTQLYRPLLADQQILNLTHTHRKKSFIRLITHDIQIYYRFVFCSGAALQFQLANHKLHM